MRRGREPHTLAGAYALDALDGKDRVRFERHLTRCDACTQEVSELRETTARLAGASASVPPADLRDRLLAAAARTRQDTSVVLGTARLTRGRWLIAAAACAALLVLAITFGVASSDANQRLGQMQGRSQAIAAVLTAHDARMMTAAVNGGGTATIVMSHTERALVFTAAGLPALPVSWGYELWLAGPEGERAAGLLPAGSHGMTGPVVASGLRTGDYLMLTAEPSAGPGHPTTPVMLDVRL